jgi:hypothetical protein
VLALVSCTASSSSTDDVGSFIAAGTKIGLQAQTETRLHELVGTDAYPYEVWTDPEFQDLTDADAAGTGMPSGTYFGFGLEEPVPTAAHPYSKELVIYGPLKLYADMLRPNYDDMSALVDQHLLVWNNARTTSSTSTPRT